MILIANEFQTIFEDYILRHITIAILFLIIVDFIWKKRNFKFSYVIIRYILLANWGFGFVLLLFNWAEFSLHLGRATGPYYWAYWIMVICSLILPILLIHKKLGRNKWLLLSVGLLSTIGLNFEIYVILITSFNADYTSNAIGLYILYLLTKSFIFSSLIIGIDLILQKYMTDKNEIVYKDVLDSKIED